MDIKDIARRFWEFARVTAHRCIDDRLFYAASALTFTTLLALVPLLAVSFTVLSAFPVFHTLSQDLQQFIFSNFIPASGQVIQQYLRDFITQASRLSIVGIIFLMVTAIMMMLTIENAFNSIWGTERRRFGVTAWLRYWAVLSLAPILIGLSIAATSYVISLPFIMGTAAKIGLKTVLVGIVPTLLTLAVVTLLYIIVPNCRVPFRYGFFGALVATVLFELAKKIFVFYITSFPTYRLIYGAMASIPIFFAWVYLSWVIVLFGILISNILTTHYFKRRSGNVDGFLHAFLWLGYLWQAQQKGAGLSLTHLYRLLPAQYDIQPGQLLEVLLKHRLVQTTDASEYVLARDFSSLTLADLYHMLPWKLSRHFSKDLLPETIAHCFKKANKSLDEAFDVPLGELYQALT